jgi:hypothetical protein
MRLWLGLILSTIVLSPAAAADLRRTRPELGIAAEPVLIEQVVEYRPVRLIRTKAYACPSCRARKAHLPWGGLRKTYVMGLPWGGLRDDCTPLRPVRRVVLMRKG